MVRSNEFIWEEQELENNEYLAENIKWVKDRIIQIIKVDFAPCHQEGVSIFFDGYHSHHLHGKAKCKCGKELVLFECDIGEKTCEFFTGDTIKIKSISKSGKTIMILDSPITIKGANKVLKYSKGWGDIFFEKKKDYYAFLSYIKKTYIDTVIDRGDTASFRANSGTLFRFMNKDIHDHVDYRLQSNNDGKWNW